MTTSPDYDSKYIMKNYPEMWMSEILYIKNLLLKHAQETDVLNILEWGSGFGTIYFSNFLKQNNINFKWTAIEHYIPWYKKVISMISKNNLSDNVLCILVNPTSEPNKNIQELNNMNDYINLPIFLNEKYNIVLIDGRKRVECLKTARTIISNNGIVILHDAERIWFHEGFKYYINNGKFVTSNSTPAAYDGIQKLWEGKPK